MAVGSVVTAPTAVADDADDEFSGTVVGGEAADAANYPWFASLFYGGALTPTCGGTLLSPTHVVTAAHCVDQDPTNLAAWAVALGLGDTTSPFTTEGVASITIDPSWTADPETGRDLAVVTLAAPVAVTPATVFAGAKTTRAAELIGFGCFQAVPPGQEDFCAAAQTLQRAPTTIYSDLECVRDFLNVLVFSWPKQICTVGEPIGGSADRVSGCFGDSGGPLIVDDAGTRRVTGVISQVFGSATSPICTGATVAVYLNDAALAWLTSVGVPSLPDVADVKSAARALDVPYTGTSGIEGQIARLYAAYFLRNPDAPGYAFWLDQLASGAWTLSEISEFFASSPEFTAVYGSVDDIVFVWLMYRNLLGREPDLPGFIFWVDELLSGRRTRGKVIVGFTESAEIKLLTGTS